MRAVTINFVETPISRFLYIYSFTLYLPVRPTCLSRLGRIPRAKPLPARALIARRSGSPKEDEGRSLLIVCRIRAICIRVLRPTATYGSFISRDVQIQYYSNNQRSPTFVPFKLVDNILRKSLFFCLSNQFCSSLQ